MFLKPKCTGLIGFTCGAFDFVHAGHVMMFEECKKYCDYLIVGLQTDPSIDRKEKNKPIMSLEERYRMLRGNKWIDAILVYERQEELYQLAKWLPIDVRFVGEDYKDKKITSTFSAKIIYNKRYGYSSRELRKRVHDADLT